MSASKRSLSIVLTFLCLTVFCTQCCLSQEWTKNPTTWWPDPSTGLMWAGKSYGTFDHDPRFAQVGYYRGFTWQQANDYCAYLQLGGFADWRLPTLDEVKAATVTRKTVGPYPSNYGLENKAMREMDAAVSQMPFDSLFVKGDIDTHVCDLCERAQIIWTSTRYQDKSVWVVSFINVKGNPIATKMMTEESPAALCTRSMDADLLQIAKDAQVSHPVLDVQTLKAYVSLNQARRAYQAGQYEQSITHAKEALAQNADPANAYWGIGASYGMLGQWDQAIVNFQSALKIDKNYGDAKSALKWAKDGLNAAKKAKQPKEPSPKWN